MKIILKNGKKIKVSQEVANTLAKGISKNAKWSSFSGDGSDDIYLLLNMNEIAAITE